MMQLAIRLLFLTLSAICLASDSFAVDAPVRVVVWDEQQLTQKQVYENFLGNAIADYLKSRPEFVVTSVCQNDPEQGLSDQTLDECDVLIWWGHVRQREIKWETGQKLVERIKRGKLSLIALHSAHWSTPFIEAMNERAVDDALAKLTPEQRKTAKVERIRPERYSVPKRDDPVTPSVEQITQPDGSILLKVKLPGCIFPAYRGDGKPSHVRTLLPNHPIAKGLPAAFDIPHTEMYDEHFHVPAPDEVIFEEKWDAGEHFRSGAVWKVGAGRVFYFRPGHETFDVYKQPETLMILENAARWLAEQQRKAVVAPVIPVPAVDSAAATN
jgi:trehalose utilization protein